MARGIIGATVAAGNAVYAVVYTMPLGGSGGIIANITAYNTTGGSLNLTLAIKRQDGVEHILLNAAAVGATTTTYYGKGSTTPISPIALQPGELLEAKGSGAGLEISIAGLKIS